MSGIVSYGAYVPKYRIDRKLIYKAMGWLNPATFMPGEKAVANYDEDSLTMAVAAGIDCLTGIDRKKVDAAFFATTTSPYAERQNAEIMATALDCRSDIRTADFTDTLKAGTTAVLSAVDAVKAGSAKNVMVCAGDMRIGKAGSAQEEIFGDGAAALLIGDDGVVAEFAGSFSVSYDFVDHWRGTGERFDQQWEDRFIRDEGYTRFIVEAMAGLEKECGVKSSELASVVYPCLYTGDFKKIAGILELSESQLVVPFLGQVGYTGVADPLMHLVRALEEAKPGDRIAVVAFGAGADAMLLEVTEKIEKTRAGRRGIRKHLTTRRELGKLRKKWPPLETFCPRKRVSEVIRLLLTALSALWRDRKEVLGLYGTYCKACGTPQYPVQRVCVKPDCGAIDEMAPYRFSDKLGTPVHLHRRQPGLQSRSSRHLWVRLDFEGGGRYWFDLTDVDLEEVRVDMPVEMSFRKKYVDEKIGHSRLFLESVTGDGITDSRRPWGGITMAEGIKDKVAIIGMGCTRFGERWDAGAEDLIVEAFKEAIEDAGIEKKEIQAAWFGSCFDEVNVGKSATPLSLTLKLPFIPVTRVENFCATGSEALRGAVYAVASGAYDICLALGSEKLKDTGYGGLPDFSQGIGKQRIV